MFSKKIKFVCAAVLLLSSQQTVQSATTSTTLAVSATVLSTCIVAAVPLVFGNYTGAELDSTATITVTCTNGTVYDVGLDEGGASGATVTTRKMQYLTNTLSYSLYRDASRTENWGETIGTDVVHATAGLAPTVHTVYGRIPASQYVTAGAYIDTVNVTVTYN